MKIKYIVTNFEIGGNKYDFYVYFKEPIDEELWKSLGVTIALGLDSSTILKCSAVVASLEPLGGLDKLEDLKEK